MTPRVVSDELDVVRGPNTAGRPQKLRRVLGLPSLLVFGLTYMCPVTVFTTYGVVTSITAGHLPAAYLVALIAMLFTALSYARMSRAVPRAGSSYSYSQKSFGPSIGFATGWALMLDYMFLPMINFLLIGIYLNAQFPSVPGWAFALVALALVFILNVTGIKFIGRLSGLVVAASVVLIVVFSALVINQVTQTDAPDLLAPLSFGDGGLGPIFAGAAVLSLSFLGFDAISTLSEEAKNPERDIPWAIILTTLTGGLIFITVAWAGALTHPDWSSFTDPDVAGAELMESVGGTALASLFVAVYVAGAFGSGLTCQASVTRIIYSMGKDGLLPRKLGLLHRRFSTPVYATLLVSVFSVGCLFIDLTTAASVVSFGALIAFSMVNLSVIKHYFLDQKRRGFWGLLGFVVLPLIGFTLTLWLWTSLSSTSLIIGGIWLVLGIIFLGFRTRGFQQTPPQLVFAEKDIE